VLGLWTKRLYSHFCIFFSLGWGRVHWRHQWLITNLKWAQMIFQFCNLSALVWRSQQLLLIHTNAATLTRKGRLDWRLFLSSRFRRLFPCPFAGLRVLAGGAALDHLVAESGARHDERDEIATAKAESAGGHDDDELRQQIIHSHQLRQLGRYSPNPPRLIALPTSSSSGSFAKLTAIRRASSRMIGADRFNRRS
jgi:hypothetical protein